MVLLVYSALSTLAMSVFTLVGKEAVNKGLIKDIYYVVLILYCPIEKQLKVLFYVNHC